MAEEQLKLQLKIEALEAQNRQYQLERTRAAFAAALEKERRDRREAEQALRAAFALENERRERKGEALRAETDRKLLEGRIETMVRLEVVVLERILGWLIGVGSFWHRFGNF